MKSQPLSVTKALTTREDFPDKFPSNVRKPTFPVPPHPSPNTGSAAENPPNCAGADIHPAWQKLVEAFPDHPALKSDTVYALPEAFLDALAVAAPGFLTPEEMRFERMLSGLVKYGFFLKRPFGSPPLLRPDSTGDSGIPPQEQSAAEIQESVERWKTSQATIKGMLAEEMFANGRSSTEIETYFQQSEAEKTRIQPLSEGYAGWLVTNAEFRRERDAFCELWREKILDHGDLPCVPVSAMGNAPATIPEKDRPFFADYMALYRRWGLESLETWELPVPLRPELFSHSLYHLESVSEAGITVFIPNYLLRDRGLTVYEVARHRHILHSTDHLREWLEVQDKNLGPNRYAEIYQLYRILELALRRRYGADLRRQVGKIDLAFARYLDCSSEDSQLVNATAESVRKLRQEMQRRLDNSPEKSRKSKKPRPRKAAKRNKGSPKNKIDR